MPPYIEYHRGTSWQSSETLSENVTSTLALREQRHDIYRRLQYHHNHRDGKCVAVIKKGTMSRAFVFLAFVLVLIAQAKAFMLAPRGSVVGAAAAITAGPGSSFTGLTVCERQATSGHGTLRMMVRTSVAVLLLCPEA